MPERAPRFSRVPVDATLDAIAYPMACAMWATSFAGFLAVGAPLLAWDYLTKK